MEVTVKVPTAFSVRDENEFYAFQHLIARMNPQLQMTPVATGVHLNGGCTVFWGLVYASSETLTRETVETALKEAGCNLGHSFQLYRLDLPSATPAQHVGAASRSRV